MDLPDVFNFASTLPPEVRERLTRLDDAMSKAITEAMKVAGDERGIGTPAVVMTIAILLQKTAALARMLGMPRELFVRACQIMGTMIPEENGPNFKPVVRPS